MDKQRKQSGHIDCYRKTDVLTANRETILLMMYAGAIRFLKQAIEAFEKGALSDWMKAVGRTQEIVNELRSSLNFEQGQEIARNLEALYEFITQRLITASMEKKVEPLKEAVRILETLNSAWEEAVAILKREKQSQNKSSP